LVLLFPLALLPRVTGLVTFKNVDEPWGASVRVLTGEISDLGTWPPLIYYLNAASFVVLYATGRLFGVWQGTADFRAQYFHDPTPFIFAGRFLAASLGALSAPLAALIASRLGLSRKSSLIVGGMVALLPVNIWLSHVAKPDIGTATAVLFLVWSILHKSDNPEAWGADAMVGAALAIALSWKQTAVFVIAPSLVGFMAILRWDCKLPWSRIARGLLTSLVACVLLWIPMNIGLIIGIKGFLHTQQHQWMTQSRSASASEIVKAVVPLLAGNVSGMTAPALVVWLIAPWIRHDRKFVVFWGASAFAFVGFSALAGAVAATRARDYLSSGELAFTLVCVAVLSLTERKGLSKFVGVALAAAILACSMIGSAEVVRQAMTIPMSVRCGQVIKAISQPERDKILAVMNPSDRLGVPISLDAMNEDYDRHIRLAKKYDVKLRERATERSSRRDDIARGYYIRTLPGLSGGMEDLPQEVVAKIALPYLWPLQEEEWDLDYWTDRGFNIFVVASEEIFLHSEVPSFRTLYSQIKERCELVALLPTTRDRFFESEVRVYRLRKQPAAPDRSDSALGAINPDAGGSH